MLSPRVRDKSGMAPLNILVQHRVEVGQTRQQKIKVIQIEKEAKILLFINGLISRVENPKQSIRKPRNNFSKVSNYKIHLENFCHIHLLALVKYTQIHPNNI